MFPLAFSHAGYLVLLAALLPAIGLWLLARRGLERQAQVPLPGARRAPWPWRAWASLALRVSILTLVVLGMAGLQWVQVTRDQAVVFLVDVSDSLDAPAQGEALAFVRAALAAARDEPRGRENRVALAVFGADAWVEWPLSLVRELDAPGALSSQPDTSQTDLGRALRLGLALLPPDGGGRLVLLSDGRATVPGAAEAAALARAAGARLDVVPLSLRQDAGGEAWVEAVDVPPLLYEGETFDVVVRVQSTTGQEAVLRLFAPQPAGEGGQGGRQLAVERSVRLQQGANAFRFSFAAGAAGFSAFEAQLVPEADGFYQNNALGAFSLVRGPPRVLIVAQPGAAPLGAALERGGLRVERAMPASMPADLAAMGRYAAIVLVDVPSAAFSSDPGAGLGLEERQMALLQAYVRDLGRGLVCVGGQSSYALGGYAGTALEETLPVEMSLRDRSREPSLGIVFVLDKSGSMGMFSSLPAPGSSTQGAPKIDLAKEAVLRSLELLQPGDRLGVVAFDDAAHWVWPLAGVDKPAVQQEVAALLAGGGTDIYAGLGAAVEALEGEDVRIKHIVLLTDGGSRPEGLAELAARLRAAGGTLSVVAVGADAAPFLEPLAIAGGGRYHYTADPSTVPQILVRETALARRTLIVEEPFVPSRALERSALLSGIEGLPLLYGYVATSLKPAAQVVLASHLDDPILARWQYGLGRVVAWTSDVPGTTFAPLTAFAPLKEDAAGGEDAGWAQARWSRDWARWDQFPRFWAQVVRWTISDAEGPELETQIVDEGTQVRITVDLTSEEPGAGTAWDADTAVEAQFVPVIEPRTPEPISLLPVAPGRYETRVPWTEIEAGPVEKVYLVRVTAEGAEGALRTAIAGLARSYSAEYDGQAGADEEALRHLAEIGGGQVRSGGDQDAGWVFARDQAVARTRVSLWPWMLAAAAALFPLDVGLRRVALDWAAARTRLREVGSRWRARLLGGRRRPRQQEEARPDTEAARLLAAKRRARQRREEQGRDGGG